ncbi:hypothetical protein [Pontibacter sp. G13]|uniref:hypothetical protein n=1 Tax=Pontibacter sp. G13 TaxID=3074898 RepID=UPI002889274B|nr:hypothetical protein [Pontibacter sp. G13]WNJ17391.1 hypothetical protein RJD25_21290 [Pontibacter sp. G13]
MIGTKNLLKCLLVCGLIFMGFQLSAQEVATIVGMDYGQRYQVEEDETFSIYGGMQIPLSYSRKRRLNTIAYMHWGYEFSTPFGGIMDGAIGPGLSLGSRKAQPFVVFAQPMVCLGIAKDLDHDYQGGIGWRVGLEGKIDAFGIRLTWEDKNLSFVDESERVLWEASPRISIGINYHFVLEGY